MVVDEKADGCGRNLRVKVDRGREEPRCREQVPMTSKMKESSAVESDLHW